MKELDESLEEARAAHARDVERVTRVLNQFVNRFEGATGRIIGALVGTINLHQPGVGSYAHCRECVEDFWPCDTVKMIVKELS